MAFFNKNKEVPIEADKIAATPDKPSIVTIKEPEHEWVTIKGFKATDKDMKCRDYQYQFGSNKYEGELNICKFGLHFCPKLTDIIHYVENMTDCRIFEVSAVIDKKYTERRQKEFHDKYHSSLHFPWDREENKEVAKEIIIERELSSEEIFETFAPILKKSYIKNYITSAEKFKECRFRPAEQVRAEIIENSINELVSYGYAETFAAILTDKILNHCSDTPYYVYNDKILPFAKALKDEGVSTDMAVYLLLKD